MGLRSILSNLRRPLSLVGKSLYFHGILSTKDMPLPDFLGIGAPQSGTTWLHENLCHHPDLFIPHPKEINFFYKNFRTSLRAYSNRFRPGAEKVKGEITPAYGALLPLDRIRFIRRIMPDVRTIFVMRNPVERTWSTARRVVAREMGGNLQDEDESRFFAYLDHPRVRKHSDYLTIFDNWTTVFPPDRLHVVVFDDIADRPRELLSGVFAHLGVSQDVDWDSFPYNTVFNRNLEYSMPENFRAYLEDRYRQDIEELHKRFGQRIDRWRC